MGSEPQLNRVLQVHPDHVLLGSGTSFQLAGLLTLGHVARGDNTNKKEVSRQHFSILVAFYAAIVSV